MPEINSLTYRGYAAQDLCEYCRFEEVAYLILNKDLPNTIQLRKFEKEEKNNRELSKDLYSILKKKHFPGLKIVETNNPLKTINISKDCKFGIANDTGCGHLIANSGIPLISLFGPTNHHKFAPIGNSKNTVISSQDLYKNNNINMIKASDVIETIRTIID